MGNLDLGKLITIILFFFIGMFFFGDKIFSWYQHKDDLQLNISNLVYTKADFTKMEASEREVFLRETSTACVNKHHVDGLSCLDTSYWLANSLVDRGVDEDLAMELMSSCSKACETYVAPIISNGANPQTKKKRKAGENYGGATKWFWEED